MRSLLLVLLDDSLELLELVANVDAALVDVLLLLLELVARVTQSLALALQLLRLFLETTRAPTVK